MQSTTHELTILQAAAKRARVAASQAALLGSGPEENQPEKRQRTYNL